MVIVFMININRKKYELNNVENYTENTSVFSYAKSLGCPTVLNFYDAFKYLLKDVDCIVCRESAADLMGYSNGGFRNKICVYTTEELNIPYLKCIVVDSLDNIPTQNYDGIIVSPIEQAIVDMLVDKNSDWQILFETLANYYIEHNDSYDGLVIPPEINERASFFKDGGIHYYDV